MKPESRIRGKIIKALQEQFPEGLFFHTHGNPYTQAGIPDILCCVKGMFVGLEVKCTGYKTTPIQEVFIRKIQKAGGVAAVVYSIEDAVGVIRDLLSPDAS